MSREELLRELQEGTSPLIVDVRSNGEYLRDRIPGAVHVSFYTAGRELETLAFAKQNAVLLYCEHGPRAGIAALNLILSGYKRVYSLAGHMKAWRAEGYPREMNTAGSFNASK